MAEVIHDLPSAWTLRLLEKFGGKRILLDGKPYLTRFYLIGNGLGKRTEVYIHHLHQKDSYRYLHNHPWTWFFSIVLKGFYRQQVIEPNKDRTRRAQIIRLFNLFRGQDRYHGIDEVAPGGTWTLVIVSKKNKNTERWGYWDEQEQCHIPDSGIANPNCITQRFGLKKTYN